MPLVGAGRPQPRARLGLALGEIGRFNAIDIRACQGVEPALGWLRNNDDRLRYIQALVLTAWITIFFRHRGEVVPLVAELVTEPRCRSQDQGVGPGRARNRHVDPGDREAGLARARRALPCISRPATPAAASAR